LAPGSLTASAPLRILLLGWSDEISSVAWNFFAAIAYATDLANRRQLANDLALI
jgi:hypothetical protein